MAIDLPDEAFSAFKRPPAEFTRRMRLDEPSANGWEVALLSEQSLAKEWNCPEEDEAWSHLQKS